MDSDLEPIYLRLTQAVQPEDVFRFDDVILPPSLWRKLLDTQYTKLKATTTQAFTHPEDVACAKEADSLLERYHAEAVEKANGHMFGLPGWNKPRPAHLTRSFAIGAHTYWIGPKERESDHFTFYPGVLEKDGRVVGLITVKRAKTLEASRLLVNESRVLSVLHGEQVPQWKHLPQVFDQFEASGLVGVCLRQTHGVTLKGVRDHRLHREGLDQRHMVWMIDRALSALGFVHRQGVVHGALSPEHLLIQPNYHNVILTDWVGAVVHPARSFERVDPVTTPRAFVAPEVLSGGTVGPWTDLYSLGKCMIWALGGDPDSNETPDSLAEPLKFALQRLVAERRELRGSDAWEVYREFAEIKDSLWKRKFLHLDLS